MYALDCRQIFMILKVQLKIFIALYLCFKLLTLPSDISDVLRYTFQISTLSLLMTLVQIIVYSLNILMSNMVVSHRDHGVCFLCDCDGQGISMQENFNQDYMLIMPVLISQPTCVRWQTCLEM